jgi:hypothetical protein
MELRFKQKMMCVFRKVLETFYQGMTARADFSK